MKTRWINIAWALFFLLLCAFVKFWEERRFNDYYLRHSVPSEKGLTAYYFDNPEWKGHPVHSKVDNKIIFKDKEGLNDVPIPDINFSINWHGLIRIPVSGKYKFKLYSDDGSWLILDGKRIVNNKGVHPAEKATGARYIRKGVYPIEIRYFQAHGLVTFNLFWRPPEPYRNLSGAIPAEYLMPVNDGFDRNFAYRLIYDIKRWGLLVVISFLILILSIINIYRPFLGKIYNYIIFSIKDNLSAFIVMVLAFIFRVLFVGTIPGVYGDETWFALTAHAFLEGKEVSLLRGMTAYTSPYYLLQVPVYILFGFTVIGMRYLAFCFDSLALIFCYMLVKKAFNKNAALFSVIILGFLPMAVVQDRIDSDLLNFSFFFTALSFYLIYSRKNWRLVLAGFILGMGIYNHLLFVSIPIALFLLCVLETRGRLFISRKFYLVLIPILLVMSIKYYDIRTYGPGRTFEPPSIGQGLYLLGYTTVNVLPRLFDGILNYKEFTGRLLINPIPINLIIVILSLLVILIKKGFLDRNLFRLLFIIAAAYIIITLRMPCPRLRYFDMTVTLTALLPAIVLGKLSLNKRILQRISIGFLTLVAVVNIFYISINYFYSFKKYKGGFFTMRNDRLRFSVFIESHHHIDTRDLYNYLVEKGIHLVATNYYIANNLSFWDIRNNLLYCYNETEYTGRKNEAMIFYEEGIPGKGSHPSQLGKEGLEEIRDVKYFRIYVKA